MLTIYDKRAAKQLVILGYFCHSLFSKHYNLRLKNISAFR